MNKPVPPYAMLFFDHLYSEYLTLKSLVADPEASIINPEVQRLLEGINEKRANSELTWSDIYTFDLALVDARPAENLIRKAYDARAKYRSIAGQKEYDEYIASKPPDLSAIQFAPDAEPPEPGAIIQRTLRADIKYLLSKIYLYYALLSVRERLRERLTLEALGITIFCVVVIVLLVWFDVGDASPLKNGAMKYDLSALFGVTVATVALAGTLGGCVSMLQRIQSAPSEGDALFNLASLTNGWVGLFLSPVYGGIFSSLLFVLFTAGILSGSVFPKITTPGSPSSPPATASTAGSPNANPAVNAAEGSPSPSSSAAANSSPISSPSVAASPGPNEESASLKIANFLRETGPKDGISYALLIIWSFIAGFAERLVPDTLNRMVAKNAAIQGTNT